MIEQEVVFVTFWQAFLSTNCLLVVHRPQMATLQHTGFLSVMLASEFVAQCKMKTRGPMFNITIKNFKMVRAEH